MNVTKQKWYVHREALKSPSIIGSIYRIKNNQVQVLISKFSLERSDQPAGVKRKWKTNRKIKTKFFRTILTNYFRRLSPTQTETEAP